MSGLQTIQRIGPWNWKKMNATPAQFRKMLGSTATIESIRLAVKAGKKMAEQLARAGNIVPNLGPEQIEYWRSRYAVPKCRANIMLCVAWSHLRYPRNHRKAFRTKEPTIGSAPIRIIAWKMARYHGTLAAEKTVRKLIRQSNDEVYRRKARKVLAVIESMNIEVPGALGTRMSLAQRGAAKYRGYLAKQQPLLRDIPKPMQTEQAHVFPKRLLSAKETNTPTVCAMPRLMPFQSTKIYGTGYVLTRCCGPVPFGGTIFCQACAPKRKTE